MDVVLLADRLDAVPTVTRWYVSHWGTKEVGSRSRIIAEIESSLQHNMIPLSVVAIQGREILGTATLKHNEMALYPERRHWIGGVFVSPDHRGRRVASRLVTSLSEIARSLGITTVYLQTERLDGGLYLRLGWTPLETVSRDGIPVLVMKWLILTTTKVTVPR